jgi:hypothetical protein
VPSVRPGFWPCSPVAEGGRQASDKFSPRRRWRRRSGWRRPAQTRSRPLRRVSRVHRFQCARPWLLSHLEIVGIIAALIFLPLYVPPERFRSERDVETLNTNITTTCRLPITIGYSLPNWFLVDYRNKLFSSESHFTRHGRRSFSAGKDPLYP